MRSGAVLVTAVVLGPGWCAGVRLPVARDLDIPPCPTENSCSLRGGAGASTAGGCYCDALCNAYADCCLDSEYYDEEKQRDKPDEHQCLVVKGQTSGVYVKSGCVEGWADAEVRELCLNGGPPADPIARLPVTSTATSRTYANYYCAICSEDSLALRIWNGRWSCDYLPRNMSDNLTSQFLSSNLAFQEGEWGVLLPDQGPSGFHPCSLTPEEPEETKNLTRRCSLATKTCAEGWSNETVASLCRSYTALVYVSFQAYGNPHCAACNYEGDYKCKEDLIFDYIPMGDFLPPHGVISFSLLFDFTDPSGSNLVGLTAPCHATQIWDPFFKKCRSIVCPKADQRFMYGKCVPDGGKQTEQQRSGAYTPGSTRCCYLLFGAILALVTPSVPL